MLVDGSWEGDAQIAAAKCRSADGETLLCCIDDFLNPLLAGVNLLFLDGKLTYEYTTVISTSLSGGKFVYQPKFAWSLEILEQKPLNGQALLVKAFLTVDSSACLYVYEGSDADTIVVAVRTRYRYASGTWSHEYWCGEEAPAPPVLGGCQPGADWPNTSELTNSTVTSWWHTGVLYLRRESRSHQSMPVSGQSQQTEQDLGLIIGASLAVVAFLLLPVLLFLCWRRRRRPTHARQQEPLALTAIPETGKAKAVVEAHSAANGQAPLKSDAGVEAKEALPIIVGVQEVDNGTDTWDDTGETGTNTWGPVQIFDLGLREHWLLDTRDIKLNDAIVEKGAFGAVRKGCLCDATPVAVKTCNCGCDSNKALTALANEMRLLRRVRHPNIVLFFGVQVSHGNLGLVLEWVEGVNLKKYVLEALSPSKDDMDSSRPIFTIPSVNYHIHRPKLLLDVSSGIQFLHAQRPPILHRDLKPSNVLVETIATPPRAKITDFGLSVLLQAGDATGIAGTRLYMAPEVLAGLPSNSSADVFSFGCTASFTFSGSRVGQHEVQSAAESALTAAKVPESVLHLIVACLQEEPSARPDFIQIRGVLSDWVSAFGLTADTSEHSSVRGHSSQGLIAL